MKTMESKPLYCAQILAVFLLMVAAVEAAPTSALPIKTSPTLSCTGIKHPNGSGTYTLSRPPASTNCWTSYEDANKTSVAHSQDDHKSSAVLYQTDRSITMNPFPDFLHYQEGDCVNWKLVEVNCTVHSPPLDLVQEPTTGNTTVNSTKTCLFGSWCPEPATQVLVLGGGGVVVLAFVCFVVWKLIPKCSNVLAKCRKKCSYTPAPQEMKELNGVEVAKAQPT